MQIEKSSVKCTQNKSPCGDCLPPTQKLSLLCSAPGWPAEEAKAPTEPLNCPGAPTFLVSSPKLGKEACAHFRGALLLLQRHGAPERDLLGGEDPDRLVPSPLAALLGPPPASTGICLCGVGAGPGSMEAIVRAKLSRQPTGSRSPSVRLRVWGAHTQAAVSSCSNPP